MDTTRIDPFRVDFTALVTLFDYMTPGEEPMSLAEYNRRRSEVAKAFPPELAKVRRQAGLLPVAINGSRKTGMRGGYFWTPLRDGTKGFLQRRRDDCLQFAIASAAQIPPNQIPDLRIEQQFGEGTEPEEINRRNLDTMVRWMHKCGMQIMVHNEAPVSERRWIAVTPGREVFGDHCVLMSRRDPLFDPSQLLPLPVAINGSRKTGMRGGYFWTPLRDGTKGFLQRRRDDCLQFAIASAAQIPPNQIPDLRIEQQFGEGTEPEEINRRNLDTMVRWMHKCGMQIMVHNEAPVSERRWIAVTPGREVFGDHCVLMSRRDPLFDPSQLLPPAHDEPVSLHDTTTILYALTIERR